MNAWGAGCGTCPACALRAAGYEAFMAEKQDARAAPRVE
jgi:7-cyano-7-deazaguanine synthase